MLKHYKIMIYIAFSFVMSLFVGFPVFAEGKVRIPQTVEDKMLYQGIYSCYENGGIKNSIDNLVNYDGISTLLTKKGKVYFASNINSAKFTTNINAEVQCQYLFEGFSGNLNFTIKPLSTTTGQNVPSGSAAPNEIKGFLEKVGYTISGSSNGTCYGLKYKNKETDIWKNFDTVCIASDGTVSVRPAKGKFIEVMFRVSGDSLYASNNYSSASAQISLSDFKSSNDKTNELMVLIGRVCSNYICVDNTNGIRYEFNTAAESVVEQDSLDGLSASFSVAQNAGLAAIKYFSGNPDYSMKDLRINDNDFGKRQLYQNYFTQFYEVDEPICSGEQKGSFDEINWYDNSSKTVKKCYYNTEGGNSKSERVNGIGSNGFFEHSSFDFAGLVDAINKLPTEYEEITAADVNESTSEAVGEDSCLAADLNGQGWLLCSALSNSTYAATFLDNVIDDWLRVDTQYYDGDSSTYKIWEVMRSIANIIMIILLLVIIVSQLSGFGINNYGIKKMLPRFIVMAILINLSFVICDVAVDFSNLMGVGLRNLFGSIGQNIEAQGTTDYIAILVTSLLSAVGIGGVASSSLTTIIPFIVAAEVVEAPMIVLVVLLALIPVIIGLAIFFIMLGGRFIIIVGCIALSPIAFTLFILPNTQGVFKKWWGLFKAALIMYPLCGAVIGISYLARGFVMTDGDKQIWMGVIAMIAPYLPFFMLPSLLKSTIGMLGTAGNALMSLGDKVKTGAKDGMDAIRHTGAYQDASKAALEKMNVQRAQNTVDKLGKLKENGNKLSESQKRRLFDAQQTVSAGRMADAQRGLGAYVLTQDEAERRAAAAKDAQELKSYTERNDGMTHSQLNDELEGATEAYKNDKNDTNRIRLQAAIMSANNRGMNNELLERLKDLRLKADIGNDAKVLGQLATSNDIILQQFGKQMSKPFDGNNLPSSQSLGEFVSGGGDVSLQGALDRIGKNALVGANDDTLKFIKNSAGSSATIDMLVTAGVNASSMKEVSVINEMLRTKVAEPGAKISIDGKQLVGLDSSTVKAIVDNGNDEIKRSLSEAFERVKSSPELMSQMNPQTIEELRRLGNSGGVAPGGGSGPTSI